MDSIAGAVGGLKAGLGTAGIPPKSAFETLVVPAKAVLILTTEISMHWDLETCREFFRDG